MEYKEDILRMATEAKAKGLDTGDGMYNFDVLLDKPLQPNHKPFVIVQVYIDKDSQYYGDVYVLSYYIEKAEEYPEHQDYSLMDLTDEQIEMVIKCFKEQLCDKVTKTNKKSEDNIFKFLKPNLTFEDKVKIINLWEEDRCCDGEAIFDLDDKADATAWINLYGTKALYTCRETGRYWMGGLNFYYDTEDRCSMCCNRVWWVNTQTLYKTFNDVVSEILDRYKTYIADCQSNEMQFDAIRDSKDFGSFYNDYIDFVGYYKSTHKPTGWKWFAISHDGSFQVESKGTFKTKKDCYEDMRESALGKMRWNTQYDEDFADADGYIKYVVKFQQDWIEHFSYSGLYRYEVVPSDTKIDAEFFRAKEEELAKKAHEEYRYS